MPRKPVPVSSSKRPPKDLKPTSMEPVAQGAASREIGGSGLPGAQEGLGFIYDDRIPELNGIEGRRNLRALAENEPIVWASLYAIEQLVRSVSWRAEPNKEASTTDGENGARFAESVLFEDLDVPFPEVVADSLTMLAYGFAIQEMIFKQRNGSKSDPIMSSSFDDGYWGVARLAPRAQDTIWRWIYGPGRDRITGIEQMLPDSGQVIIPYWKTLHYRTTNLRSNPEGRAITRGAWRPWKRKQELELAEGRMMSRAAGFVEMRIPGKYLSIRATPDERLVASSYRDAADRVAAERQGSMVIPSDRDEKGNPLFEINYKTTDSRRASEIAASIERYDRRIAMTMQTDFILIGHEAVGSYSLGESKTSVFARSVTAILNNIADQFNRVLLPTLWSLNDFDLSTMPRLVPGELEDTDLASMGGFITALAGAGMPLFPDEATENTLRDLGGLPPRSESSQAQATATPGAAAAGTPAAAAQGKASAQSAAGAKPAAKKPAAKKPPVEEDDA